MRKSRYRKLLVGIKHRLGRRTFDEFGGAKAIRVLIRHGFVAGDLTRAYLTDRGDDFLQRLWI